MKKLILSFLGVLVFVFLCLYPSPTCAQDMRDESWHHFSMSSLALEPQKCIVSEAAPLVLQNVVGGGKIDRNRNLFCSDYLITMTYCGQRGMLFSFNLYFQTKKVEEKWNDGNEWKFMSTSPNFDVHDGGAVGYEGYFSKNLEPCEIRFKVEMYDVYDTDHGVEKHLVDNMVTNTDYWISLMESEDYDAIMPPTTPTPVPTPVEVGRIFGTVSKENGKPLGNARMTIESGDYFSDKTKTDKDGRYSFEELGTGKMDTITAQKSGYQTEEKIISLDKAEVRAGFVLKKTIK